MKLGSFIRSLPLVAALAQTIAQSAHAQSEFTKHLVFTEKAGFAVGQRTTISAADATIHPDPLGRYALIWHKDSVPGPDELLASTPADVPSSSLLLYDSHTGRAKILWRDDPLNHHAEIMEVTWLSGVDAALVVTAELGDPTTGLMPDGHKPMATLLLVRPASTSFVIRTVVQREGSLSVSESPASPAAIVRNGYMTVDSSGKAVFGNIYFTVTERGELGSPIPLGPRVFGPSRWSDDGTKAYFMQRTPATLGAEGAPPTKASRQWYSFAIKTQALTTIDKIPDPAKLPEPVDTNPLRLATGALVAPPPGAAGKQPTAKSAQFTPLWVVRADGKHEGRLPTAAVIASDAQEGVLLADDSAVLYVADHTVYAVPLASQRRPDFDVAYRKMLQMQTVRNAKTVALALVMYSQDYDEKYPPAADLSNTLNPYLKSISSMNNPETDEPAFTYLLGGQELAGIDSPATTVMGYLAGPGGRAVVYADGHAKWEDSDSQ